jgi:chromosomal replication initiator protein
LDLDVVKTQLQPPGVQSLTPLETILQGVARRFGVGWSELRSGRREREIVLPRQIAMYLGRRWTELSLDEIGTFFGGRDHTTVLHACQKIDRALAQDLTLTGIVQELEEDLHAAPVLCGKPVETV